MSEEQIQSAIAAFSSGPKGRHSIATPREGVVAIVSISILRPEGPALYATRVINYCFVAHLRPFVTNF
jgi:hypothetical protein